MDVLSPLCRGLLADLCLSFCCDRLANRSEDWVRLICVVLAAEPVKVEVAGEAKELGEAWLQ